MAVTEFRAIHSERSDKRLHLRFGMGTMQIDRAIHSERDATYIAISVTLTLMLNLTLTVNGPLGDWNENQKPLWLALSIAGQTTKYLFDLCNSSYVWLKWWSENLISLWGILIKFEFKIFEKVSPWRKNSRY